MDGLVLAAIERDVNTVADYDINRAMRLVTLKLVGYTEVVHALGSRISPGGAIVLFGGLAKERPYPGSTTVSTVNGGVAGLLNTLVVELAPIRVNAIHPGIVGDSPYWRDRDLSHVVARTPCGHGDGLVTSQHMVECGRVHAIRMSALGRLIELLRIAEKDDGLPRLRIYEQPGASMLSIGGKADYPVILANLGGAWRSGVQTDVLGENLVAVFVPNSPNPLSGGVFLIAADRVRPAGVSLAAAMGALKRCGTGAGTLFSEQRPG